MICLVSQSRYIYTDLQRHYDTTLAWDMHARLRRTWYFMIHGPLLLQVLVLHIYVTRISLVYGRVPHITILLLSLYGYCSSPYMILGTDHCYSMYMLHRYYDPTHSYVVVMSHRYIDMHHFTDTRYTDSIVTYAYHTSVHACIISIFLSYDSLCLLHRLLLHVTVFMYMIISCYRYGYSRYWTWELLICDMWTSTSIVPVILFLLYCSRYIVPDSRYIVLCYQQSSGPVIMLPVSCTVFVLVTLYTWHIRS